MAQIVWRQVGKAISCHKVFDTARDSIRVARLEHIFAFWKKKCGFQNGIRVRGLCLLFPLLEQLDG